MLQTRPREAELQPILLPSALQDGYLVHAAVLARRLDVLQLPRQVLLAGYSGEVGVLSFVHGVPQSSTSAGVTHAQDKRLRRTLLNLAKIPTPPGITFSARGDRSLQNFLQRFGFPVVLKQAISENPSFKIEISNVDELSSAISRMRLRSEDQLAPAKSLNSSAYAEYILGMDPTDEAGRLAPPTARLLIEKRVSGRYIRCLVCGKDVIAAIEILKGGPTKRLELWSELHQGFQAMALKAAAVIPGLAVASVDLVVADPAVEPQRQSSYVVEVCERVWLASYMDASPETGAELADKILTYEAHQSSVVLEPAATEIAVHVRVESLNRPRETALLLRAACNALRITGRLRRVDNVEGTIEAHLQGHPGTITLVSEALMSGVHFGERAMALDESQTSVQPYSDFRAE